MPRYDFRCSQGHTTEAVTPMAVDRRPCPCGAEAVRQAVYAEQTIIGDTVPKPRLGSSSRDKAGRFRLGIWEEAQSEIIHDAKKAGVEPPDLFQNAKRRVLQTTE